MNDRTRQRRERLERAERLLDAWLGKFEAALDGARVDPSKTTELANVFTVLKRIQEIELLDGKLEESNGGGGFQLDRDLHGEPVLEDCRED